MAKLQPFIFYSPKPELAANIAINSYDSYSKEEITDATHNHELSFINIIHKEADMHRSDFYALVRKRFNDFVKKEWLVAAATPALLIYKKTSSQKSYTGIIALSHLQDLVKGIIHLHENTIEKRENILAQYIKNVKLNAEPVALIYDNSVALKKLIANNSLSIPFIRFKDQQKEIHELWKIDDANIISAFQKEFTKIDYLLVADGHHRIKSSWRNYQENKNEPYFMSIFLDEDNIDIEPYTKGEKNYSFQEIKSITLEGKVLPPKSTWILPKLKTGLCIYDLSYFCA
ncbi:MAG: DUF1015 family protein [Flavobacteriales bacterium]